jgi:phage gpG-like protein
MRGTSTLMGTSALRKSIMGDSAGNPIAEITGTSIKWKSSLTYANIHNEGGTITVTPKMKGFFKYKVKINYVKGSKVQSPEYQFWLAMFCKPVGGRVTIPKRQFIGDHPQVHTNIKDVCDYWVENDFKPFIDEQLNNIVR